MYADEQKDEEFGGYVVLGFIIISIIYIILVLCGKITYTKQCPWVDGTGEVHEDC